MTRSPPLPAEFGRTRTELQRVATHILARGRADHGGRFGLRATPSGIGTPAFGPAETVLRIAGTVLLRERRTDDGDRTDAFPLPGHTLAEVAASVGVDLTPPFSPGADAPGVGDADCALELDSDSVAVVLSWFAYGATVLDAVMERLDDPTAVQLWPEHFDIALGTTIPGGGVTLGASPGDAGVPEPYLYMAPYGSDRPGDPAFWNAAFGAVLRRSELDVGDPLPVAAGVAFLHRGLDALDG